MKEIGSVDLVPSPRVLRMLGNIEFENWQCLAELIDNSIDALMESGGGTIGITTPSPSEFDSDPGAFVKVWDDGPGMSKEQLQNCLKAGYSSNDPLSRLGLFGMGFNIATARLGKTTQVITTRKGDSYWTSVVIDFKEMEKSGNYVRPLYSIEKLDRDIHGTQVIIKNLGERVRTIRKQSLNKKNLSRIYSPVLQKGKIKIIINSDELESRGHCIWGKDRSVERGGERIPAYLEINKNFGKEYYCINCWEWIDGVPVHEGIKAIKCPGCGDETGVIEKERTLSGWLGVQRHYDPENYGIDLIRNGRVIEPLCKDFFFWMNPVTGEKDKEYVLDATFLGGRLVGELNIDFVPLTYMKDHFEKADKRWKEVENHIRGNGPLRPEKAKELGYPENNSPLGLLYKGYKKANRVGKGDLYPGDENGKGVNEKLKEWAEKFHMGDPEYQDDTKWWELVEIAEMGKRSSGGKTPELPIPCGVKEPDIPEPSGEKTHTSAPEVLDAISKTTEERGEKDDEKEEIQQIEKDVLLSQEYEVEELKETGINVTVNKLITGNIDGLPIKLEIKSKDHCEVIYDPNHTIFNGFNLEPLDLILLEISQKFSQRKDDPREWPPSKIFSLLKEKYSADEKLSPAVLSEKANEILVSIKKYLVKKNVPVKASDIEESVINEVRNNVLSRIEKGEEEVTSLLKTTRYVSFAPEEEIRNIFVKMPEIFLDGKYWKLPYEGLGSPSLKDNVVRSFSSYINDILWLKREARDYDPEIMPIEVEYRLQRASYSLKLLEAYRE